MKELQYKYNIGEKYSIGDSEFVVLDRKIDIGKDGRRVKNTIAAGGYCDLIGKCFRCTRGRG